MGIFDKKKNQQNYIDMVRRTTEEAMPQLTGWDITLTTFDSGTLATLKKSASYAGKLAAMNVAASLAGLHVRSRENPFAETLFITCFKGTEIYFLSVGPEDKKWGAQLQVDPEECMCFKGAEIESIKTSFGKKVTMNLRDGGKFQFKYGIGAGTIYHLIDGDKKLEQFVKNFA